LVKLLFHGTKSVTPKEIYEGNQGLDMRFSRPGMFGQGIYFADSPNYSDAYAYQDNPWIKEDVSVFCAGLRKCKQVKKIKV
jgi:hypothetical protein